MKTSLEIKTTGKGAKSKESWRSQPCTTTATIYRPYWLLLPRCIERVLRRGLPLVLALSPSEGTQQTRPDVPKLLSRTGHTPGPEPRHPRDPQRERKNTNCFAARLNNFPNPPAAFSSSRWKKWDSAGEPEKKMGRRGPKNNRWEEGRNSFRHENDRNLFVFCSSEKTTCASTS